MQSEKLLYIEQIREISIGSFDLMVKEINVSIQLRLIHFKKKHIGPSKTLYMSQR